MTKISVLQHPVKQSKMRFELFAHDDRLVRWIVKRVGLIAFARDHLHRAWEPEIRIQRLNLGSDDPGRKTAFHLSREQHRLPTLGQLVEHRAPAVCRQLVFLDTVFRAFLGQVDVFGKIIPRVRIAAVEQTDRVIEPLFVWAMCVLIGHRVFGIRHRFGPEAVGDVIGHRKRRLRLEQMVNEQDRRHIGGIFLLPEHGHLHHVDQRMTQFVIENPKDVCVDKGILRLVGHQTAGDTGSQKGKRVSHTGIKAQ